MPRPRKPRGYLDGHGRGLAVAGPVVVRDAASGEIKRIEEPVTGPSRVPAYKVRSRGNQGLDDLHETLSKLPADAVGAVLPTPEIDEESMES